MIKILKTILRYICLVTAVIIVVSALCVGMFFVLGLDRFGTYFSVEQTNLKNYRNIVGNQDNSIPSEFISSYFPDQIEPFYSNVEYHYRAQMPGTYACEAMVEFSIDDTAAFDAHYNTLQQYGAPRTFPYDSDYEVWVIADKIRLYYHTEFRYEPELSINYAEVGFILCDKQSHKFVYAALLVAEGGSSPVKELDYMLEKFDIKLTEQTQSVLSKP